MLGNAKKAVQKATVVVLGVHNIKKLASIVKHNRSGAEVSVLTKNRLSLCDNICLELTELIMAKKNMCLTRISLIFIVTNVQNSIIGANFVTNRIIRQLTREAIT